MARQDASAERRFVDYLNRLGEAIGHRDRLEPLGGYLQGLLLPGERKSVEPLAARIDPRHVSARHQSLHHFVSNAPWDEREVLRVARDYALCAMERHAPIAAWIVDDTGMPKKGSRSVGVARQYCGQLGKNENCQVAVTVSLANSSQSVPAGYRLFLPEEWTADRRRCDEAGVPKDRMARTKWQIALELIDELLDDDIPRAPVLADGGYGHSLRFRQELRRRGLTYAVGLNGEETVWVVDPTSGQPQGRMCSPRLGGRGTYAVPALARTWPKKTWQTVRWRAGTKGTMSSRFHAVRVIPAHEGPLKDRIEEWLLVEWPEHAKEPERFWFANVPADTPLVDLVRLVKLRWRIERDYQELKDEIGLDHFEGRSWRGFHHHAVLCIAAYAFLAAERARLSPPEPLAFLHAPRPPKGFKPRGAAGAR